MKLQGILSNIFKVLRNFILFHFVNDQNLWLPTEFADIYETQMGLALFVLCRPAQGGQGRLGGQNSRAE